MAPSNIKSHIELLKEFHKVINLSKPNIEESAFIWDLRNQTSNPAVKKE